MSVRGLKSNPMTTPPLVLDFGASVGTLATIWKELTGQTVECLEIDQSLLKEIRGRGYVGYRSISEIQKKYNFIYSSNVLEHIQDDSKCISELANILEKGGRIGVYVPAKNVLFSEFDKSLGHYRRYGKREITKKFESNGFRVIDCKYLDFFGFFIGFTAKYFSAISSRLITSKSILKFYDRVTFPMSRIVDKATFGTVIGKNILIEVEKI